MCLCLCVVCEGVKRARVSLMAQKADIEYLPDTISAECIVQHIIEFGFGASLLESGVHTQHGTVDLQVCGFPVLCASYVLLCSPCVAESIMEWFGVHLSVCLSVCFVNILTMTHQGAACEASVIHFGLTIRRTDILVCALE